MDILRAEIAKKRKLLEEKNLVKDGKKYFKRGDLTAMEQEEYFKKYGQQQKETSNNVNTVSTDSSVADDNSEMLALPRAEVIQRLRERGEPILLYGETEIEAFCRLRRCEILEPEVNKGFRNDFQEAMDKVDQAYLDELLTSGSQSQDSSSPDVRDSDGTEITYESIQKLSKSLGRGNRELDMKVVMSFLQFLLKMWNDQLNNRTSAEKMGTRGKMVGATYAQTQVYLKPLLRKLKNHSLPEDISDSLTEIVRHLLNRNYLMASDAYLQMAIGNAPWPIGVTMVGIHARTGREKIFSKNVAHVMNDETQRKYIQALKRLMTKCQEYFPTDPSRCVEYAAFGSPSQTN